MSKIDFDLIILLQGLTTRQLCDSESGQPLQYRQHPVFELLVMYDLLEVAREEGWVDIEPKGAGSQFLFYRRKTVRNVQIKGKSCKVWLSEAKPPQKRYEAGAGVFLEESVKGTY